MTCKCGKTMDLLGVFDTGSSPGADGKSHAHNIYLCDGCGMVAVKRVWDDAGETWVSADGKVDWHLEDEDAAELATRRRVT